MLTSMARRVVPINDWAPAQEAMYDEASTTNALPPQHVPTETSVPNESRFRSVSLSLPWRHRPKSSVFNFENDVIGTFREFSLDEDRRMAQNNAAGNSARTEHALKGIFKRASVSLKGIVQRRPSVPAAHAIEEEPLRPLQLLDPINNARPTTAHSTWRRLRQAASFRHSRLLYTGYGERPFEPQPPPSPAVPVPGSGEQPPIIPQHTGAAAKAAASLHNEHYGFATIVAGSALRKQNNWLLTEDVQNDHESGIGIALTSSEVAEPETDVDDSLSVDEDEVSGVNRIDFISQLPAELAIHILSQLDAAALSTASRVSRDWNNVIKNQHIWRESFMREKTGTCATGSRAKPGAGLGVPPVLPTNDWREIYRVKEQLDRRWKLGKARPVYLNGHSDSIYCLQFDENKIITGSRDKTIRVWDMHTFACRLVIGPPDVIHGTGLLYDSDGNHVHYATMPEIDTPPGPQIRRCAPSTPALLSFAIHHKASILCLQYDDSILVTGSSDATCIVYNIRSGYRPVSRLQHHSAAVLDLTFDDKHIVTCSKDISICVWDRATGSLLKQLRGHTGPVNAVQMRGNTIVSCSGDYLVKLWNIDTGKNIREFQGHTKGLACSQFSEDGRYIASAGNDMVIRVWDANTGECAREMRAHELLVRSLHIDSVSGRLVSGSYDQDIKVFDLETGRQLLDFPRWHSSWVLSAKSDYRRIVSTGQDPKILVMDFGAGVEGIEMLESAAARLGVRTTSARPDSEVLSGYI